MSALFYLGLLYYYSLFRDSTIYKDIGPCIAEKEMDFMN